MYSSYGDTSKSKEDSKDLLLSLSLESHYVRMIFLSILRSVFLMMAIQDDITNKSTKSEGDKADDLHKMREKACQLLWKE